MYSGPFARVLQRLFCFSGRPVPLFQQRKERFFPNRSWLFMWITILEIFLLLAGLFLIVMVLLQHGKSHGLSGTIAGGAETFFGKEKGKRLDRVFSRATTTVSVLFVLAALVLFILMPDVSQKFDYSNDNWSISPYQSIATTEVEADSDSAS